MLVGIRSFIRKNLFLRKLTGYYLASSGLFDHIFKNYTVSALWEKRISDVLRSSDNEFIPRVKDAGEIRAGKQIMHNGLKIHLGSYYGPEYAKMLMLSKGVHEPQEERMYMEVLKSMPPHALMIEMGAFWSFYSMWFNKEVPEAVNYMIEPDSFNLGQGKRNFSLNKMKGTFIQAFVAQKSSLSGGVRTIGIDDFVREQKIDFIHMLHSDIQGFEYEMLLGAQNTFKDDKVGFVFISTHSNEIHYKCLQYLKDADLIILASADLDQTFSEDGLIAARSKKMTGIDHIAISQKTHKQPV